MTDHLAQELTLLSRLGIADLRSRAGRQKPGQMIPKLWIARVGASQKGSKARIFLRRFFVPPAVPEHLTKCLAGQGNFPLVTRYRREGAG